MTQEPSLPDVDRLPRELARFARPAAAAPAWLRHCPQNLAADPVLRGIAGHLARPQTLARLIEGDRSGDYPATTVQELQQLGLAELFCDTGPGTPRATAWHLSLLNLLTARTTTSLAITVGVNTLALLPIYRGATAKQRQDILSRVRAGAFCALALTELEAGSDLSATTSLAALGTLDATDSFKPCGPDETATHMRLTLRKHLINGGARHDVLLVLAASQDLPGGRAPSMSLVWLDRPADLDIPRRWQSLPARAADISELRLDDAIVPLSQCIGAPGQGFAVVRESLALSRGGVAALAAGLLSRARELTLSYATKRSLYGAEIGQLAPIRDHIAWMDAMDRVAAAASLRATAWVNASGSRAAPYTAVAKLISCRLAEEAVTEGRAVLGARALLSDLPYESLIRDVLLFGVFDGTAHVMLDELQAHLSLQARRSETAAAGDPGTIATVARVYAEAPRSLVEAGLQHAPPQPPVLTRHTRALARLPGSSGLDDLVLLTEALMALVAEARRTGLWTSAPALRFAFAEVYALLEATVALVEIFDPDRRAALIGRPIDKCGSDGAGYAHALGWMLCRTGQKLMLGAAEFGLDPASLDHGERVQEQLSGLIRCAATGQAALRQDLAGALLREQREAGQASAQIM